MGNELEKVKEKISIPVDTFEEQNPERYFLRANLELKVANIEQNSLAVLIKKYQALQQILKTFHELSARLAKAEADEAEREAIIEEELAKAEKEADDAIADSNEIAAKATAEAKEAAAARAAARRIAAAKKKASVKKKKQADEEARRDAHQEIANSYDAIYTAITEAATTINTIREMKEKVEEELKPKKKETGPITGDPDLPTRRS